MARAAVDISVIIVNYNVKEFLANTLQSVRRASDGLSVEVFVVDNASTDGSREMLEPRFPEVRFIWNEDNRGFGKANNQAIDLAAGAYTLLLNPDTLLQEDTLQILKAHMDANPAAGASGCRILNPDGTFAPESRRSIPTLFSSVCKALGLTSLFPRSKVFARYYLGWMDELEAGSVPVLSGSFMFYRTEALKQLGGFDERFFMYGEDIDLCLRTTKAGWRIDYVPATSIIHYKGESTKKDDLRYIRHFNEAMYLFFEKHDSQGRSAAFRAVIWLAIALRALLAFVGRKASVYRGVLGDLAIVNASLLFALAARWGFDPVRLGEIDYGQFLWLNALVSALYVVFARGVDLVRDQRFEVSAALRTVAWTFAATIVVTFFARELAFSRIIVMGAFGVSLIAVGFARVWKVNRRRRLLGGRMGRGMTAGNGSGSATAAPGGGRWVSPGKWARARVLMVGVGERTGLAMGRIAGVGGGGGADPAADGAGRTASFGTQSILGVIHQSDWNPGPDQPLEVAFSAQAADSRRTTQGAAQGAAQGVTQGAAQGAAQAPSAAVPIIGSIEQLPELAKALRITHIVFLMDVVRNSELLSTLSRLRALPAAVRIIPQELDLLLGKSEIDYLEDLPLMDIPAHYLNPVQRGMKRLLDLSVSAPLFVVLTPMMLPLWLSRAARRWTASSPLPPGASPIPLHRRIPYFDGRRMRHLHLEAPVESLAWMNLWLLSRHVVKGDISLVGSMLSGTDAPSLASDSGSADPQRPPTAGSRKPLEAPPLPACKSGVLSLAHLSIRSIRSRQDLLRIEEEYLKRYSIWLDVEILLRIGLLQAIRLEMDPMRLEAPGVSASHPASR